MIGNRDSGHPGDRFSSERFSRDNDTAGEPDPGERGSTILDYLGPGGLFMVDRIAKCRDVVSEFEKVGAEIASADDSGDHGSKRSIGLPSFLWCPSS